MQWHAPLVHTVCARPCFSTIPQESSWVKVSMLQSPQHMYVAQTNCQLNPLRLACRRLAWHLPACPSLPQQPPLTKHILASAQMQALYQCLRRTLSDQAGGIRRHENPSSTCRLCPVGPLTGACIDIYMQSRLLERISGASGAASPGAPRTWRLALSAAREALCCSH